MTVQFRIGIDVGGTNTDSVILDQNNKVVGFSKVPTTKDVMTGVLGFSQIRCLRVIR